ncbi:MAG: hypothetical protein ABSB54_16690 [Acidimicrobiales bacterium]
MTLAILASGGLALALGLGLPDRGAAERAFAALIGLLGCVLAMQWLRSSAEGAAPQGRFAVTVDRPEDVRQQAPAVESAKNLERALRLGASTIGSYNLLVRPRLQALAAEKLERTGCSLSDRPAAKALLGDELPLVDPAAPPPADSNGPGISLHRIGQLVGQLERMP